MKLIVFYSWQSDRPSAVNNDFIKQAAQLALERVKAQADMTVEPALDRDTQDVPGSPGIAESILQKIDTCGLFLADVTIISDSGVRRQVPNPNVMLELGYAVARVGWERVICVMNEEFGGPTKLPFDLQHRRWPIRYRLAPKADEDKRAEELERLSQAIELAVRTVIQSGLLVRKVKPKDRRAALKFEVAVQRFLGAISGFFANRGGPEPFGVFSEDQPDAPGSQFPDPVIVEPHLKILSENSLKTDSTMSQGDKPMSWLAVFLSGWKTLFQECDKLLDQFSDCDDLLILVVDDLKSRAEMMMHVVGISVTTNLASLYDKGVPDVHTDIFRYFLLTFIKAQRVARSFTSGK